jgi:hypothetical protein
MEEEFLAAGCDFSKHADGAQILQVLRCGLPLCQPSVYDVADPRVSAFNLRRWGQLGQSVAGLGRVEPGAAGQHVDSRRHVSRTCRRYVNYSTCCQELGAGGAKVLIELDLHATPRPVMTMRSRDVFEHDPRESTSRST